MYASAAHKLAKDEKKRKSSENVKDDEDKVALKVHDNKRLKSTGLSSDDDSTNTPDPIQYETPSTSPQSFKGFPFSPGRFCQAGCKSAVFTYYNKDEEDDYRTDKWNQTYFTGQCKENDIPAVGSVISLHCNHIDPDRFKDKKKKADFYGVVVEWDKERFPDKDKNWVQIKVIGNGEYVTNALELNVSPNFVFDLVIINTELEVIVPAGCKSYEVFADNYGKNPLRWFRYNIDDEVYEIKNNYETGQCPKCLDPGCLMFVDKEKKIAKICDKIQEDGKNHPNNQLRFKAYRDIARHGYGQLPKGVRRRLGICCELFVRSKFPEPEGMPYVNFKP